MLHMVFRVKKRSGGEEQKLELGPDLANPIDRVAVANNFFSTCWSSCQCTING